MVVAVVTHLTRGGRVLGHGWALNTDRDHVVAWSTHLLHHRRSIEIDRRFRLERDLLEHVAKNAALRPPVQFVAHRVYYVIFALALFLQEVNCGLQAGHRLLEAPRRLYLHVRVVVEALANFLLTFVLKVAHKRTNAFDFAILQGRIFTPERRFRASLLTLCCTSPSISASFCTSAWVSISFHHSAAAAAPEPPVTATVFLQLPATRHKRESPICRPEPKITLRLNAMFRPGGLQGNARIWSAGIWRERSVEHIRTDEAFGKSRFGFSSGRNPGRLFARLGAQAHRAVATGAVAPGHAVLHAGRSRKQRHVRNPRARRAPARAALARLRRRQQRARLAAAQLANARLRARVVFHALQVAIDALALRAFALDRVNFGPRPAHLLRAYLTIATAAIALVCLLPPRAFRALARFAIAIVSRLARVANTFAAFAQLGFSLLRAGVALALSALTILRMSLWLLFHLLWKIRLRLLFLAALRAPTRLAFALWLQAARITSAFFATTTIGVVARFLQAGFAGTFLARASFCVARRGRFHLARAAFTIWTFASFGVLHFLLARIAAAFGATALLFVFATPRAWLADAFRAFATLAVIRHLLAWFARAFIARASRFEFLSTLRARVAYALRAVAGLRHFRTRIALTFDAGASFRMNRGYLS